MPGNESIEVKPWVVAVFTIIATISGGLIKDRMSAGSLAATEATRLDQMDREITQLENRNEDFVTKAEFKQYTFGVEEQLEDIKSDLKEIKSYFTARLPH